MLEIQVLAWHRHKNIITVKCIYKCIYDIKKLKCNYKVNLLEQTNKQTKNKKRLLKVYKKMSISITYWKDRYDNVYIFYLFYLMDVSRK
jgi:hypothetical protein